MKTRDVKYEIIRVIAMLFVLIIHEINMVADKNNVLYYITATLLLTGVPLFFMLSGKFAFNIDYKDKKYLGKYYKKKFLGLIIPILVYMIIKEFHVMSYNLNKEITLYSYIRALFVSIFNGYRYMEYWYLYVLIAYLLIVPFVGKWVINATKSEANIFLAIILIINTIMTLLGYVDLELSLEYPFATYGIYFFVGYFLDKFYSDQKSKYVIYCLGTMSFILTIVILILNKPVNVWSYSPLYTFFSVMIFTFIRDFVKLNKIDKIITFLGKHSLAVYMMHMMYLYIFHELIPATLLNPIVYSCTIIIFSLSACILSSIILENTIIKWLKNITNKLLSPETLLRRKGKIKV